MNIIGLCFIIICIEELFKRYAINHIIEHVNGLKEWYFDGKRHRINGPAFERANGTRDWYFNNEELSEDKYNLIMYYYHMYSRIVQEIHYYN